MSTLYWITILGNLYVLGVILTSILLTIAGALEIYIALCFIGLCDEENAAFIKKASKIAKRCLLYSIVPLLMATFIPSTKQLYAIYGVGTVIDYAKGSKEAQKLPDNAVKALNVWLENVNTDKKDSTNNN